MRVAVLDLGKTNAKLALVETDQGDELRVETRPTPSGSIPYPHLDSELIGTFLEETLGLFASEGPIDAITVTAHGATGALIDAGGELALPVLDYEFDGMADTAAAYDAIRPSFAETGSPRLPGGLNLGAQLFWQQETHASDFRRADRFLTWPQYWVYRLCGAMANDVTSLGCHTDLYAPHSGEPSSMVRRLGWQDLMPQQCKPGEKLGTLEPGLARRTGLSKHTPVHAGIHDSNASLVPRLSDASPVTVVSTGTWVIVMALGGDPVVLDERRDTLLNVDARGRPVPSARFMGGREHALAHGGERAPTARGTDRIATLERALDTHVMLLPSLVPDTGPYPCARSDWLGDHRALLPDDRSTLIAVYLALMTDTCISLVDGQGRLVLEGPMSADETYALTLATLTGRAVQLGSSRTGTAGGAAMLIARPIQVSTTETIEPAPLSLRKRLFDYRQRWQGEINRDETPARAAARSAHRSPPCP